MKQVLVVANQTAGGRHLLEEITRRARRDEYRFTLLVPAAPPQGAMTPPEELAFAQARERMERALVEIRHADVEIDGILGSADPMNAIAVVARTRRFDEIIISTLPKGRSRWLEMDLPNRVAEAHGVRVTHVVGSPEGVLGPRTVA